MNFGVSLWKDRFTWPHLHNYTVNKGLPFLVIRFQKSFITWSIRGSSPYFDHVIFTSFYFLGLFFGVFPGQTRAPGSVRPMVPNGEYSHLSSDIYIYFFFPEYDDTTYSHVWIFFLTFPCSVPFRCLKEVPRPVFYLSII